MDHCLQFHFWKILLWFFFMMYYCTCIQNICFFFNTWELLLSFQIYCAATAVGEEVLEWNSVDVVDKNDLDLVIHDSKNIYYFFYSYLLKRVGLLLMCHIHSLLTAWGIQSDSNFLPNFTGSNKGDMLIKQVKCHWKKHVIF